jgi:hypothetical protein
VLFFSRGDRTNRSLLSHRMFAQASSPKSSPPVISAATVLRASRADQAAVRFSAQSFSASVAAAAPAGSLSCFRGTSCEAALGGYPTSSSESLRQRQLPPPPSPPPPWSPLWTFPTSWIGSVGWTRSGSRGRPQPQCSGRGLRTRKGNFETGFSHLIGYRLWGLKGYRVWAMGQLVESNVQSPA